ncbi:Uncharacterised protein [Moraxella lacunata]|uniref:Uncharacterized protein n=1 Tax=Moraxella lacunata TaxID=477 RepID=A0A378T5B8_MORLA|nr:hypothetical protein [Moraxella lacunata]STZ56001.1 Uncharacterised protein [Moraxella lacunata]
MKKFLLFPLMAILATNAYANNKIDTVKNIVALAENGDIFNLTKTAESLNLKDEIDRAKHQPVAYDNRIEYTYPIHTHQAIQSISYSVSFGGRDLSEVHKNVSIAFKSKHCPSIDDLQIAFGEKLMVSEWGSPPSLQIGQNGSRQGVRYESYYISTSNQLIFVENNGCEFSVLGRTDEFK